MRPGRALDAVVAEKVMGWRWYKCEYVGPSIHIGAIVRYRLQKRAAESPHWNCTPSHDYSEHPKNDKMDFTPRFTTDISAAWEVLDKLRGKFTNIALCADNGWALQAWNVDSKGKDVNGIYGPNCKTAAEAICRCALDAFAKKNTRVGEES